MLERICRNNGIDEVVQDVRGNLVILWEYWKVSGFGPGIYLVGAIEDEPS